VALTAAQSDSSAVLTGPGSTSCDVAHEDWRQANLGALFASSCTKHRLAVLCHKVLASAAAITYLFFFITSEQNKNTCSLKQLNPLQRIYISRVKTTKKTMKNNKSKTLMYV
jgi:hypothetical protein